MCGEKFKKKEIEKLVPLKMLYETKIHMERRNLVGFFQHFPPGSTASLMHSTRICTLCYLIAIHEKKLIEVSNLFLLFLNKNRLKK